MTANHEEQAVSNQDTLITVSVFIIEFEVYHVTVFILNYTNIYFL